MGDQWIPELSSSHELSLFSPSPLFWGSYGRGMEFFRLGELFVTHFIIRNVVTITVSVSRRVRTLEIWQKFFRSCAILYDGALFWHGKKGWIVHRLYSMMSIPIAPVVLMEGRGGTACFFFSFPFCYTGRCF